MRNFDYSLAEIEAMPPGIEKAIQLAVSGLLTDGAHHKQWFLEQILLALGDDIESVRLATLHLGYEFEPGIPP